MDKRIGYFKISKDATRNELWDLHFVVQCQTNTACPIIIKVELHLTRYITQHHTHTFEIWKILNNESEDFSLLVCGNVWWPGII